MWSTTSTRRIFLCGATRAATNSMISSGLAGSFNTTNAFGTSSPSSSSTPITATSAMLGWESSSASSSAGATWNPLYLMSSFNRSTMKYRSWSSIWPMSPVWKKPSASIRSEQRLELGGGHLESLVLDELLQAIDDEVPVVVVDVADVTRVEEAVRIDPI